MFFETLRIQLAENANKNNHVYKLIVLLHFYNKSLYYNSDLNSNARKTHHRRSVSSLTKSLSDIFTHNDIYPILKILFRFGRGKR